MTEETKGRLNLNDFKGTDFKIHKILDTGNEVLILDD